MASAEDYLSVNSTRAMQIGSTYLVLGLTELITSGILSSGCTSAHISIGVLGDVLVGLLGGGVGGLADLVADVVAGVPEIYCQFGCREGQGGEKKLT